MDEEGEEQMSHWVMAGMSEGKKTMEMAEIMDIVCLVFQEQPEDLHSRSRKREFVAPRHVFCYLSLKYTRNSLKKIGKFLSGRDHATILHANRTCKNLMETENRYNDLVRKCELKVKATIGQLITI